MAEASELVRVVRTDDGGLQVGRSLPGRGAWLCAGSPACLDLALRRRAFSRALRGPVGDGGLDEVRDALARPPAQPIGDTRDDGRHW